LEGHIFDIGVKNQAYLFTRTLKEIADYAGRMCKEFLDIRTAIETLVEVTIPLPGARNTSDTGMDTLLLVFLHSRSVSDIYLRYLSV